MAIVIGDSVFGREESRSIENWIRGHKADFYLTGSRFFLSAVTSDRDYDYFVNADLIDENELKVMGFTVNDTSYVDDPSGAMVYTGVCGVTGFRYDIQLIPDVNFRIKVNAQKYLEHFFRGKVIKKLNGDDLHITRNYLGYTKEERRMLWDLAISIVENR